MERIRVKQVRRTRRKRSIRRRLFGLPDRPRLSVFRSSKHIYAQLIDDLSGRTLAAASSVDKGARQSNGGNCEAAAAVGKVLADRAKAAGIERAIFDRSGYRFHGRVKALAEAVREGGVKI